MGVTAMGADDLIIAAQSRTDRRRNALLSDGEMDRAAHFLPGIALGDSLLDHPDPGHAREQATQKCLVLARSCRRPGRGLALEARVYAHRTRLRVRDCGTQRDRGV